MENFDYQSVLFHYLHCLSPPYARGANYLRHLAAQYVPAEATHTMAVNPANYSVEADRCTHFRSTKRQRYIWGISNLFDNIPYKKAVYLKRKMHSLYPRTTYHHILYQEHALSPGEQEETAALFLRTGINEVPVFDRHTDEYSWDGQHTPKGNITPQLAEWMNG